MKHTIIKPVISEKSLAAAAKGWYTFAAVLMSRKPEIASAINALYGVTVTSIHTLIMHGKERKAGKRMKRVHRQDWKKAIVKLKSGQKIDAFDIHESHETHGTH
ncbi:50S ribosomal protein L23 [Candidatus Gottesmanbacteria bacterium]|nr:50S ribosomal protein L23 [Candidatus Gottesmanbacteria bacterium]